MRARNALALGLALALLPSCRSSPPPAPRSDYVAGARAKAFDSARAWEHLRALTEIGPRVAGTPGGEQARAYIRGELEKLGLEIREQEIVVNRDGALPLRLGNIGAAIPGESSEIILLLAPYDTREFDTFRFVGANDGGSGAALLLELARVLAAEPLPYTTWVVFLDGEAKQLAPSGEVRSLHLGSRALVQTLARRDKLGAVRLAVVLNRLCDADLHVARDLLSSRVHREEFWRAARRLGHGDAFGRDVPFESIEESHAPLTEGGLRRVVVLADTSFGGGGVPGVYANTEDDDLEHCDARSLAIAGQVTLEALNTITRRLAKVDRFAESPLSSEPPSLDLLEDEIAPPAETAASPAAEPAGEASAPPSGETAPPEASSPPSDGATAPEAAGAPQAAAEDAPAAAGEAGEAAAPVQQEPPAPAPEAARQPR